ncbi:MAG: DNA-directed RNA polymerase subunit beta [Clostridium sp.]|nr:DNA-directed RNA polymerase subunit beta [Clostridium sp.]MDY5895533.1 DNA-directed RNA polymerase subunit beta [Oscillospiraceae bacterium]
MLKVKPVTRGSCQRMSFGKIDEVMDMPNLIEVQKASYNWFIEKGLKEVFRDMADITDYTGNWVLSFIDYRLDDKPKYSVRECKERDANYAAPMRVTVRLQNKETGVIKESEVYMGDFPIMTDSGTFVINGAERVIVSQLVRSPGVYYGMTHDKTGIELYTSTINPNRGAWLEYETDANDIFYVRIDKNRKIYITAFVRALGLSSNDDIRRFFGEDAKLEATMEKDETRNTEEALIEVFKKLRPGEPATLEAAQQQFDNLFFDSHKYDISRVGRYKYNKKLSMLNRLPGCVVAEPVISEYTGELIAEPGEVLTKQKAIEIEQAGVMKVVVRCEDGSDLFVISNGMVDPMALLPEGFTREELDEIAINEKVRFSVMREVLEKCGDDKQALLEEMRLRCDDLIPKHIIVDDIFASVNYVNCLTKKVGNIDDIDHLGNRRIRSVGELLQNQFRIGLARMERVVRERMAIQAQEDEDKITPQSLINIRPVMVAVREFFGSSPLSQFMDQHNPLAELTHKRRLSALGPGGLSRDRAGFEVRDVHYSHYGRMCPIETPEGPNIGLISYLATFAKINEYGFIEAPFRKIDKETGVVLDEVEYMTADTEDEYIVAQANEPLDENNRFVRKKITARHRDEFLEIDNTKADYMDVSPKMVVSVATALIPFLENDDANRALMGSNMQKQAVPLLKTEAPIVGTGMEYKAAVDSGSVVLAKEGGVVSKVAADSVDILEDGGTSRHYELIKFMRSNQGTCTNQRPIVSVGQRVEKDEVIADGPAIDHGELSLGKNALVGFMTWEGYNYEDAVLINEKLVRDDVYTSIHIEEYETEARDTKLGPEEITRDIPNVGEDALGNLDDRGIIRIGAEVHSGDILVGKVTPKGETELTAEERLLRAIFGEKAKEVRDTSLKVPHGEYGIVVNVEVFTKENSDELSPGVNKVVRCYIAQKRKLSVGDKMAGRHGNKGVVSRILPQEDMPFLPDGTPLDIVLNPLGVPSRMNIGQVLEVHLGFAARALGYKIMTPVFDGAHEEDITEAFAEANRRTMEKAEQEAKEKGVEFDPSKVPQLRMDCKSILTDGRTGRKFDNPVTVGVMYYLKLHHLVDDKIHARSTGPYSLVTQQPLGGKAQFGGQRFGEMEVWALEAYGAAYTLQEILTVKSDDVVGRVKTYEAIVKGKNVPTPGIPESFRVLIKELQSLALDIKVLDENGDEVDLRQTYDNDDAGFAPDDKAFQSVNDAEGSDDFIVDEDSEENDIFIRDDGDDDDGFADEFRDKMGDEDYGLDLEPSEDDYE